MGKYQHKENPPTVKIIKVGTLCLEASESASPLTLQLKSDLRIGGGCTVTLIEAEQRILVDTGYDYEWLDTPVNDKRNARNIIRALEDEEITPEDIDIVFITHWHRDHFGNIGVFEKSRLLSSRLLVERSALDNFTGIDDQKEIADGVKVVFTPGHTIDHASIIVQSTLGDFKNRIAIAGDAIVSYSYFQSGRTWRYNADFYSIEEARGSSSQLINSSDIIVPGHGAPFMTFRPEWAKPES